MLFAYYFSFKALCQKNFILLQLVSRTIWITDQFCLPASRQMSNVHLAFTQNMQCHSMIQVPCFALLLSNSGATGLSPSSTAILATLVLIIFSSTSSPENTDWCKKHRKNCECCPVSLLIVRWQRLPWIQVLNCQNFNQCLKGHKSLGLLLEGIL